MAKLKSGVAFSVLSIAAVVIAYIFWWYQIETTNSSNALHPNNVCKYQWTQITCTDDNGNTNTDTYDKDGFSNLKKQFATSLTLLTIGGAFEIAHLILQVIGLIFKKMPGMVWKVITGLIGGAAVILIGVSFLIFLQIPQAFIADKVCSNILFYPNSNSYQCGSFLGSFDGTTLGDWTYSWTPGVGWDLAVVATFFALLSVGMTIASDRHT